MSDKQMATINDSAGAIMERVIVHGDLSKLTPEQRATYYLETCNSLGINPLTKPFDYLTLSGKMVLYATKTATDQLRTERGVSIFRVDAETVGDLRIVTAYARDASGREDMDIGAVSIKNLQGSDLANAYMKALTKAKRRVTLSICGLGWLDESELDGVPAARPITVNVETGEIVDEQPKPSPRVTEAHLKRLHALGKEKDLSHDDLHGWAVRLYGVESMKDLTILQATAFADKIKGLVQPEPPAEPLPDAESEALIAEVNAVIDAKPGGPGNDRFTR